MRRIGTSVAFVLIQLAAVGGGSAAHAETSSGVSVGVGVDALRDGTITDASGANVYGRTGELGLGVLGNVGDFAVGGGLGWSPAILSDGRLLLGARAGWQPTFGTTRVQLLGEVGIHRYTHVAQGLFSASTPDFVSTPYLGAQLGFTRQFVKNGLCEYGVALFVRRDLNQQTVVHQDGGFLGSEPQPPIDLTVGGTMIGASFTLGFRADSAIVEAMKHR